MAITTTLRVISAIVGISKKLGWFSETHWPGDLEKAMYDLEKLEGRKLYHLRSRRDTARKYYLKHHHAAPWDKRHYQKLFNNAVRAWANAMNAEARAFEQKLKAEAQRKEAERQRIISNLTDKINSIQTLADIDSVKKAILSSTLLRESDKNNLLALLVVKTNKIKAKIEQEQAKFIARMKTEIPRAFTVGDINRIETLINSNVYINQDQRKMLIGMLDQHKAALIPMAKKAVLYISSLVEKRKRDPYYLLTQMLRV